MPLPLAIWQRFVQQMRRQLLTRLDNCHRHRRVGEETCITFPGIWCGCKHWKLLAKISVDARRYNSSTTPNPPDTKIDSSRTSVPIGHTPFSWNGMSKGMVPCGHSRFSWNGTSSPVTLYNTLWETLKLQGNKCFKRGEFYDALTKYSEALTALSGHAAPSGIQNISKEKCLCILIVQLHT